MLTRNVVGVALPSFFANKKPTIQAHSYMEQAPRLEPWSLLQNHKDLR